MTLTEFLLARITEDEGAARQPQGYEFAGSLSRIFNADRVLAECAAKREVVDSCSMGLAATSEAQLGWEAQGDTVLRHLATIYAEHPDCREEWRP